jgi:hypothetical protein
VTADDSMPYIVCPECNAVMDPLPPGATYTYGDGICILTAPCPDCAQIRTSPKKVRGISRKTFDLRAAIISALSGAETPVTVRQMYYLLSVAGAVDETEAGYGRAQRQLLEMRRAGTIPYSCAIRAKPRPRRCMSPGW